MNHLRILDMLTMYFDHIHMHPLLADPPFSPSHCIQSLFSFKCSFSLEFYKSIVFILFHVLLPPAAPPLSSFSRL